MQNTTKLIKYSLGGFTVPYDYEKYKLQIEYYGGYKDIYNGRSFINADGTTEPRADKILRDFVWRWNMAFLPASQRFVPECLTTTSSTLQPIENSSTSDARFITTNVKCLFEDGTEQIYDVTGSSIPLYQKEKYKVSNPFDVLMPMIQNYSTLSAPVPHIPMVSTDNFWLGCIFSLSAGMVSSGVQTKIYLSSGSTRKRLYYSNYGDYAASFTLRDLLATFPVQTKDRTLVLSDESNINKTTVAVMDACPNKYYLSFITPTVGWQCVGFDSLQIVNETDNDSIVTIEGLDKNIWTNSRNSYTVNSPILDEENFRNLCSIPSSYICYLYDVEKDQGQYVTCTSNNSEAMKSWASKKQIQLTFKDNYTTIR